MERTLVKIQNINVDTFTFDEALDYAKAGQVVTINPEMIDYASKNNMTSDFMMDLSTSPKLNPSITEELKAKDVEIKTFKNKKDAIQNSKTGEVFCLADEDFISIKTSDSEISPLKITPESYKKLFPPVKGKVTTQNFHLIVIY